MTIYINVFTSVTGNSFAGSVHENEWEAILEAEHKTSLKGRANAPIYEKTLCTYGDKSEVLDLSREILSERRMLEEDRAEAEKTKLTSELILAKCRAFNKKLDAMENEIAQVMGNQKSNIIQFNKYRG